MCAYSVYKHTSPSGKVYIGITSKVPERRWQNGTGYHHNPYFSSAIQKYGWENIDHEIIAKELSFDMACKMEIDLIAQYRSNDPDYGYNLTSGGEGRLGYAHSEETKRRISEANTGKKRTDEEKHKMSLSRKGRKMPPFTDEHRQRISESCIGRPSSRKGTHLTDETKYKLSEANKGKCIGAKSPVAKKVCQYDMAGNFIKEWDCIRDVERTLKISSSNITTVCKGGRLKSAGGYIWKYA